jgi:hypothetical protein
MSAVVRFRKGWCQWDYQLGTMRGEVDDVTIGVHGGEFVSAQAWADAAGIRLSAEDIAQLDGDQQRDVASAEAVFEARLAEVVKRRPQSMDSAKALETAARVVASDGERATSEVRG